MTALSKSTYRKPVKQQRVEAEIKGRIVSGRWQPSERLPSRQELLDELQVSTITLQRACDQLVAEGFLLTKARGGTFVHPYPPHLCSFGLVLNEGPKGKMKGLRYRALTGAARELQARRPNLTFRSFEMAPSYFGDNSHGELLAALQARQLAGLIFLNNPYNFIHTPIMDVDGIPAIAFSGESAWDNVFCLSSAASGFHESAAEYLKSNGCRQPALLLPARAGIDTESICRSVEECGLHVSPEHILVVPYDMPECTANLVRLLATLPRARRPDSIILIDDNLVEDVAAGIVAAGLSAPKDMRLVSVANFPALPKPATAVTLMGIDYTQGLEEAVKLIERFHQDPDHCRLKAAEVRLPWLSKEVAPE